LRETLFNILAPQIAGTRFLDLCAGSGAVAIEALSRGAAAATLVEKSAKACSTIKRNLRELGLQAAQQPSNETDAQPKANAVSRPTAGAELIERDVLIALRHAVRKGGRFDLVFFDPPYDSRLYDPVLTTLGEGSLISNGAIVVVEHRVKRPPAARYGRLGLYRQIAQGESALAFYRDDSGDNRDAVGEREAGDSLDAGDHGTSR
jgi:16S rRNA (guanine(966)-N(2))-methyltransferase RsmD